MSRSSALRLPVVAKFAILALLVATAMAFSVAVAAPAEAHTFGCNHNTDYYVWHSAHQHYDVYVYQTHTGAYHKWKVHHPGIGFTYHYDYCGCHGPGPCPDSADPEAVVPRSTKVA